MENDKLYMKASDVSVINHYYIWLMKQVDIDSHQDYTELLRHLHSRDFYWTIPNDENRSDDGKALRVIFMDEMEVLGSDIWLTESCSVLEMLVALAKRIELDVMPDHKNTCSDWFWLLICNLGLEKYTNVLFSGEKIDEILHNFMSRNGVSVLFKIQKVTQKQLNNTEFWYQMHIWLAENYENDEN